MQDGPTNLEPASSERLQRKPPDAIAQRAGSASLSPTASWRRSIAHGPEIRPALLQAFPSAGQPPGPDRAPSMPTAAQRLAQLQRSIAGARGSMPSPSNSWGKSITQVVPYSCAHHPLFQQLCAAQLSLTILVVFLPGKMLYSVD